MRKAAFRCVATNPPLAKMLIMGRVVEINPFRAGFPKSSAGNIDGWDSKAQQNTLLGRHKFIEHFLPGAWTCR